MWTPEPLHPLTCPRCTAALARTDAACHRCGQAVVLAADGARLVAAGTVCPRCSRPARPGEAYHSAIDWSDAAACPHCGSPLAAARGAAQIHEEKAEVCAPHALERLVRAEAVDGWALWDTTIDPRDPGMLLVHFRRPGPGRPRMHTRAARRRPRPSPAGCRTAIPEIRLAPPTPGLTQPERRCQASTASRRWGMPGKPRTAPRRPPRARCAPAARRGPGPPCHT